MGRAVGLMVSTGEELTVFGEGGEKEERELDLGGGLDSSECEWIDDDDELGIECEMLLLCLEATINPLFLANEDAAGGETEASPLGGGGDIVRSSPFLPLSTVDETCCPATTPDFEAPRSSSNPVDPAPFKPTSLCLLLNTATDTFLSSTIVSSPSSSSSSSTKALLFLQSPD